MKYGIFGGSFDPMHLEHIKIIQNAYKQLGLDKVIIVPSLIPHTNQSFTKALIIDLK